MKWRSEFFVAALLLGGCTLDQMNSESRLRPYAPSPVFADGSSSRLPVPGTVARGALDEDDLLYHGVENGRVVDRFPFPIEAGDLDRGRERFDIHCAPCHGRRGLGDGMIARRGFSAPPSYFSARVRRQPVGHYVQVMTSGFGAMMPYADQVEPRDRWRIAAYIRALQLSREISVAEVPRDVAARLLAEPAEKTGPALDPEGRPQ